MEPKEMRELNAKLRRIQIDRYSYAQGKQDTLKKLCAEVGGLENPYRKPKREAKDNADDQLPPLEIYDAFNEAIQAVLALLEVKDGETRNR